jgi:hypothetical protein
LSVEEIKKEMVTCDPRIVALKNDLKLTRQHKFPKAPSKSPFHGMKRKLDGVVAVSFNGQII